MELWSHWLAGLQTDLSVVAGMLRNIGSFIIVFGILVFIHELGHFLVAKWCRVRVHEFALGFGPALLKKRFGETLYALRIFPLGGFVKLAGMEPTDTRIEGELDPEEDDERAFHRRPIAQRMAILAAGPLMNVLLAILVFAGIFTTMSVQISGVVPESPAEQAGLLPGDRLVSIDGEPVITSQHVLMSVQAAGAGGVRLVVDRAGQRRSTVVVPRVDPERGVPMLGVELSMGLGGMRRPAGEALRAGIQQTWMTVTELVRVLGQMISGQVRPELAGPIGIYQITGSAAEGGVLTLLTFLAAFSVHLAVFNLLPIPILDGGGLLFLAIEAVRGRPLNPEHKGVAQLVGLSLLLLLLVFATMQDLRRLGPSGPEAGRAPVRPVMEAAGHLPDAPLRAPSRLDVDSRRNV